MTVMAVVAAVTACAPAVPARRDAGVRIASVALFDAARFAGRWQVVASHVPGCDGAGIDLQPAAGGYRLAGTDCTGARPVPLFGAAVVAGPGARIAAEAGFGGDPVWVLWVDQDYRVAALGTPSGRWAMILAREGAARADLLAAAREVLDFNGYDLAQMTGAGAR
jgi:apolipoprotein D and lipocalin family protein